MRHWEGDYSPCPLRVSDHVHRDRPRSGRGSSMQPHRLPRRGDHRRRSRPGAPWSTVSSILSSPRRPGTGSTWRRATSGPGSCCAPGGHLAFWSATHVTPDGGDPFFVEIQMSTRRSARGYPRARTRRGPAACSRTGPRSNRAVCSKTSSFASSTGRSATTPRGTSRCSTRPPATSPWRHRSATTSTQKSDGASDSDRTAAFVGTGERSYKSRADPTDTDRLSRNPNLLRERPRSGCERLIECPI